MVWQTISSGERPSEDIFPRQSLRDAGEESLDQDALAVELRELLV